MCSRCNPDAIVNRSEAHPSFSRHSFPLTPALSPGARENRWPVWDIRQRSDLSTAGLSGSLSRRERVGVRGKETLELSQVSFARPLDGNSPAADLERVPGGFARSYREWRLSRAADVSSR